MKRGQTAMEYIMTYGWVVLIMLVVVGVLFYLGVFNRAPPQNSISSFGHVQEWNCGEGRCLVRLDNNFTFQTGGVYTFYTNMPVYLVSWDGNLTCYITDNKDGIPNYAYGNLKINVDCTVKI